MLRRSGHDQRARVALAEELRALTDRGCEIQEAAAVAEKLFSFAGQHEATPDPIEELEADFAFEIVDLPGQCRLRDMQLLRRLRDGAELSHGDKCPRPPQVHQ